MAIETKVTKDCTLDQFSFAMQGETSGRFWAGWNFDDGNVYFVNNKDWNKSMLEGDVISMVIKEEPVQYYVDKDGKRLETGHDRTLRAKDDQGRDKLVKSETEVRRSIINVKTLASAEKTAKIQARAKTLGQRALLEANTELLDLKLNYRNAVTKAAETAVLSEEQRAKAEAMLAEEF